MWKNITCPLALKDFVKRLEERIKDYQLGILYFIFFVLCRNLFYSLFNNKNFLFLKEGIYNSIVINIYFILFYGSLLVFFLFFTKLLINRRTERMLSFFVLTFSLILLSPFIDFFISLGKGYKYNFFNSSLKSLLKIPPGMKFEILLLSLSGFIYAKANSRKFFKWILLPFLYAGGFIFLIVFPYYLSKGSYELWKGGIISYEFQKLSVLYSLVLLAAFFVFFLFFKEYKRGVLKEFINYDFLFFNAFLPFMGFWIGYKLLIEEYGVFFDVIFNRFIPLIILIPPLLYSLTSFFYRTKKKYFYSPFISSLLFSFIISFFHFVILLLLYIIYFLNRSIIKTRKTRPFEVSSTMILLFIFGYSIFTGSKFWSLADKKLVLFLFLFFFFYGFSRYLLMKRKKTFGFVIFTIGILILPLLGFVSIFYYSLLLLTIIFISFFYFLGAPSLKTVDLITYFFITLFFVLYLILPSPQIDKKGFNIKKLTYPEKVRVYNFRNF